MNNLSPEQQLMKLQQMKDYHNAEGLNRSRLMKLVEGPKGFDEEEKSESFYEEKESFIIGTGAETRVLLGDEAYNAAFFHPQLAEKPSDKVMSVMQRAYSESFGAASLEEITDEALTPIMIAEEYRKDQKWGLEAKLRNLRSEGEAYYNSLAQCGGRQLVSTEEVVTIGAVAEALWASPRFQKYLKPANSNVIVEVQSVIFFEYRGYRCKAMLDIEHVDHEAKTARVIDLKTTKEKILNFPTAIRRFRYDLQVAFYCQALRAKYPGYTILEPVFVVASTTEEGAVMDFCLERHDVEDLTNHNSRYLITLKELFNRLDWYGEHGMEKHFMEAKDEPVMVHIPYIHGYTPNMSLYGVPCPSGERRREENEVEAVEAGVAS